MTRQPDLFTGDERHAACSKGWGARCASAKSKRCRCACGGINHGNPNARQRGGKDSTVDRYNETRKLVDRGWDYTPDRTIRQSPASAIELKRTAQGEPIINLVDATTGKVWPLEQRLVKHSPTGMEFGYGGSGPADLALNILALVLTPPEADRLHQAFKSTFLAAHTTSEGGMIAMNDAVHWITDYYAAEQETPPEPRDKGRRYDAEQEFDEA